MKIGRGVGSMLGASLVVAAALAATARAEPTAPTSSDGGAPSGVEPPSGGAVQDADRLSPMRLLSGPSLYETGRVGTAPKAAPTAIEPQEEINVGREKSVDRAAADIPPPAPRTGFIDQAVLDQQIEARFAALENCRVDAARGKRMTPNEITASTITLRWTIRPNGGTADTVVVATSPLDLEVMSCVKAAMIGWKFMAPRGGPVHVERTYTFRALR